MKRLKKILALLFALVMTLSMVLGSVVYADEKEDDAKKKAVQAQIAAVQAQIDAKKKELTDAKGNLDKAKNDTKNAKAKLQAAEQQSAVLAEQIELIEEQIDLLNENIEAVELAEKDQYDLFCQQVRQEEERGELSYWSVLFKASGFDDLLSRIDFINEIMEYDQQIMENLQGIRAELKDNRTDLETQEAELDEAHAQQEKLAAQYAELYKDYKQTEEDLQALYDEAVAEEAALESTMKAILDYQHDFFLDGDESHLRPMVLKDIAAITGFDISTISRVANSKYIETHFGIYPLKYFFSEGLENQDGEEVSTRELKKALQDCVDGEDKRKPLTDEQLVDEMNKKGYKVARRTIAKYRDQLNIPKARMRKEL